ncbi:MAG: hypothetical protein ACOYLV_08650 [Rubrivivax sp.]
MLTRKYRTPGQKVASAAVALFLRAAPMAALLSAMPALLGPSSAAAQPASGAADRSLPWVTPAVQAPRVVQRVFDSAAVGAKVSYHAYVPAAHGRSPELRLPVLYWLHGTGGGCRASARWRSSSTRRSRRVACRR